MQCSGSLELLSERRKNLEMLVQQRHNVANINYNFSYAPRLPDSPTRVDRLMYDISRERCRVSISSFGFSDNGIVHFPASVHFMEFYVTL